ncbi:Fungal specific transcription factor [Cordyceps fumosorosea ARSEF 2679]|uniref:Fungal specific transcription factor n=1 Tax=Cordyceps fumosorosea (strain ARSEF 2679) TaxID=1081104 RepID=A0A167LR02_CORFA|nr:Fungal specific transcription factor [Cordyceps fumosorosea ARSEF 2679]OAA53393.1 Fungal specific transcription factor [Cordyceps fumosorosea ARSEF 2679]
MPATANNDAPTPNIHRFRVRRTSTVPESAPRRRSASPPVGPLPLPRDIPACDRCRNFKKKCSRTFPVCSLCASAGHQCSFSTPVSSAKAQTHHLRARVEWLSRLIDENLLVTGCPGIEGVGTGSDLTGMLATSPAAIVSIPARAQAHSTEATPDSVNQEQQSLVSDARLVATLRHLDSVSGSLMAAPQDPLARTLVNAYFRHIHRAYPFMNRARVLHELEALGSAAWPPRQSDSTLLFLVMALGCTTLQRSGQMPRDATGFKYDVPSAEILQECLLKDDVESIQILVLLALHCMYDPAAASTWSVAGIASRKAMSYGLTRRASNDSCLSSTDKELRYRLFWSVWVLDRVMAYSTGLAPALCDESTDVPLPGLAVEEFASPERQRFASVLQIHRHIIRLRQLEDRILAQVLSRKQPDTIIASQGRLAIVREVRTDIENWYSEGCLLSPVEPDNIPIHASVAWLGARYYHLLLMLHYPCPFNGFGAIISAIDLLRFIQKHLQSTLVLLQQRQLPLNLVTLTRTLPVGLALLHCLMSGVSEMASTDEVDTLINVFEAFPDNWAQARRAAHVFRQVRMVIVEVSGKQTLQFAETRMQPGGPGYSYQVLLKPLAVAVTAVMEDTLGKPTCYAIPEFLCERGSGEGGGGFYSSNSPTNPIQSSLLSIQDETTENSWGSLQFAFM